MPAKLKSALRFGSGREMYHRMREPRRGCMPRGFELDGIKPEKIEYVKDIHVNKYGIKLMVNFVELPGLNFWVEHYSIWGFQDGPFGCRVFFKNLVEKIGSKRFLDMATSQRLGPFIKSIWPDVIKVLSNRFTLGCDQ